MKLVYWLVVTLLCLVVWAESEDNEEKPASDKNELPPPGSEEKKPEETKPDETKPAEKIPEEIKPNETKQEIKPKEIKQEAVVPIVKEETIAPGETIDKDPAVGPTAPIPIQEITPVSNDNDSSVNYNKDSNNEANTNNNKYNTNNNEGSSNINEDTAYSNKVNTTENEGNNKGGKVDNSGGSNINNGAYNDHRAKNNKSGVDGGNELKNNNISHNIKDNNVKLSNDSKYLGSPQFNPSAKTSTKDSPGSKTNISSQLVIVIGSVIGGIIVIGFIVFLFFFLKRRQVPSKNSDDNSARSLCSALGLIKGPSKPRPTAQLTTQLRSHNHEAMFLQSLNEP